MVRHSTQTQTNQLASSVGYMHQAIALARKGAGFVQSNPMVGSVLVDPRTQKILAQSYHAKFGGSHAERRVLEQAMRRYSKAILAKAVLYVTLEPCCHTGKTKPCLDLVVASGVRQVVIGSIDPNPQVAGKSIRRLRQAGIHVTVGVAQAETDDLIRTFRKWITTKQPYVLAKVGMSIDGKITASNKQSYITNEQSLERVHQLRQEFDVIMVGANTIIHDNPRLNTRLNKKTTQVHHPIKVILDSRLRTPATSRALDERTIVACLASASLTRKRAISRTGAEILEIPPSRAHGKLLFDQLDMRALLSILGERGFTGILLEGGSYVFTSFINLQAVDEFQIFVAPYVFGATQMPFTYALQHAVNLANVQFEQLGNNILIRGYASYTKIK